MRYLLAITLTLGIMCVGACTLFVSDDVPATVVVKESPDIVVNESPGIIVEDKTPDVVIVENDPPADIDIEVNP